ncbi:MAG TPA: DUF362 domain-containing protein [Acidobacteriota bacterium]
MTEPARLERRVGILEAEAAAYPKPPPFHPSTRYPEYPFAELASEPNPVYAAVRELFRILQLDAERFGSAEWNPLGALIRPGDRVVLKPNFVMDRHYTGGDYFSVVTHGSVIRAVADYVTIALGGSGEITIADAPMIDNDFDRILRQTGVDAIAEFYAGSGRPLGVFDLRVENVETRDGLIVRRFKLRGDPNGYVPIDLGAGSELAAISSFYRIYRGSDYDGAETFEHHNDRVNEYLLSRTVLRSDVFINLPKLKTHKKIGVTLNLKNLIGINGDKNWIPHYRRGSPRIAGDEYHSANTLRHLESLLKDRFKEKAYAMAQSGSRVGLLVARKLRRLQKSVVENTSLTKIRAGGWHGNDTLWRSVLDLNKILLYADAEGRMHDRPQRRFLSLIDGIIGGEGDGPVITTPKPSAVLVAGFNPLAVDLCATRLMGFDPLRFTQYRQALALRRHRLADFDPSQIECVSNRAAWCDILERKDELLNFAAPTGWRGEIELG